MAKNKIKIPTAFDQRPDATGPIIIALPLLPPSSNALFKNARKGRVKTDAYNSWLSQMGLLVRNQCKVRMPGRSNVAILIEDKDNGADCDNRIKPAIDLLVHLGILQDDSSRFVRSVSATWTPEIEGLKIQVWPVALGAV
jgi:Holliday junction resolvase RusA-like endonuclease